MDEIIPDYKIGVVAALSMYIAVLFVIFQAIVMPLSLFIMLLAGISDSKMWVAILFCESVLVFFIVRHVRRSLLASEMLEADGYGKLRQFVFDERVLQRMLNITAAVGIIWILFMGMPVASIKYFLLVVDLFGLLFLSIFFVVRIWLTKEINAVTVLSMLLPAASVWIILRSV